MANASISLTGITLVSKLDNFSFINTNWWQFFFEKDLPLDGFVTSDWHAFFFERGIYLEALGQANNQLSGIESSSAIAYVSAIGQINAIEDILGIEANALVSELIASGFASQEISGIDIFAEDGNVAVTISDSEIVNGIESVSFAGQATATADAYFEQSGLYSETDISSISFIADANYNINGNQLISSIDTVSVTGDSVFGISGNEANSENGEVTASNVVIVNASVELDGIQTLATLGNVSGISESPETWSSSGQVKRYPANQFVSATAKPVSVTAKADIGEVQTITTTVINSTISLNNVVSFTQASDINASGTLEISDEELILLLAA